MTVQEYCKAIYEILGAETKIHATLNMMNK